MIHENSLELPKRKNHFLLTHCVQTMEENLLVTWKYTKPFHDDESRSRGSGEGAVRKSLAHESGSRFGDNSRRRSCVSVDPSPPTPKRERKPVHR